MASLGMAPEPVSARAPLDNVWVRVREIDILRHVVETSRCLPSWRRSWTGGATDLSTGSCTTSTYTSRRAWGATACARNKLHALPQDVDVGDLPPVTGRHRTRALAADRRRHAVEMALTGHTYQAIADRLGYANRADGVQAVAEALEQQQVETVDERGARATSAASTCSSTRMWTGPTLLLHAGVHPEDATMVYGAGREGVV